MPEPIVTSRSSSTAPAAHSPTGWLDLDNSDDNFERGHTDCFFFVLSDLGTVNQLGLNFDGDRSWHLRGITVNGRWFPYYNWVPYGVTTLDAV
jgi:hypothetical protein